MYKLGADLVLSQDMETSLTFLFHILRFYNLPDHVIRIQTNMLRKGHYNFFTKNDLDEKWKVAELDKIEKDNEMFFIGKNSKLINKNLTELKPFIESSVNLMAVIRDDKIHTEDLSSFTIQHFDTIIFSGNHIKIQNAINWFERNNY